MPNELTQEVLGRLAKLGAQARLEQIETERKAILSAFPDLVGRRPGRKPGRKAAEAEAPAPKRRRRSKMSAEARKAVSVRMKKYWADRRKAKGKE